MSDRISITHSNNATFSYFRWVSMPGHLPLTGGFRMQLRRPFASPNVALEAELSTANGRIVVEDIIEATEMVKLGFQLPLNVSRNLIGIYDADCLYEANDQAEPVFSATIIFDQGVTR